MRGTGEKKKTEREKKDKKKDRDDVKSRYKRERKDII